MKWVQDCQWTGKQTPGHVYKPTVVLTKPRSSAVHYYPRSKPEGGGPGIKAIKQTENLAPGYYKVKRTSVERSTH